MLPTLAKEYIGQKLLDYEEPVRKGKAKGKPVGLSRRKYTAALVMAIYAMNTQEVEEITGNKRNLISKWNTEPKFLTQMEEIRSEFCSLIINALINGGNKDAFTDSQYFSTDLNKLIIDMCDVAAGKGDGDFLLKAWNLLRPAIISIYPMNTRDTKQHESCKV